MLCLLPVFTVAEGTVSIILENVTMIDKLGEDEDETVNIVIKDGYLDLVTKDGMPEEPGVPVYNANGAVLLGVLDIGKPAGFLLLDESPRDNVDILLDTKTHAVFAIARGEIRRNRLLKATSKPEKPSGWFAYTPPPISLPMNYELSSKWNHFQWDKASMIFSAAVVLDRTRWKAQDDENVLQVGDLREFDGGEIRGLRFGIIGALKFKKPWLYTIFGATNAFSKGFDTRDVDDFAWFDYRVDIPVFTDRTLSVGKQKEPISMERIMSMIALPFQERTAGADALLPSRNVGVVLSGTELSNRLSWAGGLFNDWLDTGGSRSDSSSQVIGRVTGLPWITEDESNLLHLGIGYRYSNAKEGLATGTEPEINMAPEFVNIDPAFTADRLDAVNYELSWRKGPFWLSSEYTKTKVKDAPGGDLGFSSYHVAASWILTGEMRPYNYKSGSLGFVPVSRPVNQGGWGAWEFDLRYSYLDLTDRDIFGGEMDVYSLALNWWLRPTVNVNINWRYVELDKPAEPGGPILHGQASGFVSRVLLILD